MHRDTQLYLSDIVDAIQAIETYLANITFEQFAADRKTVDAVVRNLEVIGEAAGKLTQAENSTMPEIDWRKIVAMRNILAHEYFGVSKTIVWDVVKNHLPNLSEVCRRRLWPAGPDSEIENTPDGIAGTKDDIQLGQSF